MIEAKVKIRKCGHCRRYFVVTNLNMRYCSRIADGEEKPCNVVGSKSTFDDRVKSDEALKLYNRAYKTQYSRIKNGTITKAQFIEWKKSAKEKLDEVRNKNFDIGKFAEWLKKIPK